ncbi:MAG: glycoside hydrolase [Chloroflexaceae bacterium]|nr:glycoside hydrolase [Chloroflexaceae bacterium]
MFIHHLPDTWAISPLDTFQGGNYLAPEPEWLPITVPAHWQQHPALETHTGNVVYRCHFAAPALPDRLQALPPQSVRFWLRVNGVFYWSQPYFNGADLGCHEGYFDPYEHDITALLQPDNTLLMEVSCPEERNKRGKRMITGVFSHWDCLDPHANPGGIWLPVELHASGPTRIQAVRCHSEAFNDRFAQLRYAVDLDAAEAGPITLRWTIAPRTFEGDPQTIEQQRTLRHPGPQTLEGMMKLRNPRLWWSHDLGHPDLYTITLEVLQNATVSDAHRFAFGVRRFELRNWIAHLNGVRLFIKGSNYAPGDMRIATMTAERAHHDLRLARECHMNFLRVHAHVEHPTFYEAANEAGVLLWQDMPLQWLYQAKTLPEARRQAHAMVNLLANHPAVVTWCMHNEPLFVADTSDETLLTRLRTYRTYFLFSWNRDIMDTQLKRVAQRADPHRPVIRSSGEFAIPVFRRGTDAHAYFGWYSSYGTLPDYERLRRMFPANLRFVTEFGAQSFPNVESCVRFMPADLAQIDFSHLAERHSFQPEVMAKWIPWRTARSLEELVAMTQDYQIFINRYYIDRLRFHKYRPTGGIVPFMFVDSYPAILWSILDYWRVPKRSYHAMRLAFSPQYAFTILDPKTHHVAEPIELPLYVVNDARDAYPRARLVACLRDPDEAELAAVEHTVTLGADCLAQEVDRLRWTPTRAGRYTLELELTGVPHEMQQVYPIDVVA